MSEVGTKMTHENGEEIEIIVWSPVQISIPSIRFIPKPSTFTCNNAVDSPNINMPGSIVI